jgi:hypothetical protein
MGALSHSTVRERCRRMRHHRVALVTPLVAAVLAAGCISSVAPDNPPSSAAVIQGDVEYTAETQILESFPVQLNTIVRMRNRSRSTVQLRFGGGCPVQIRAYRDEARTQLAWDQGRVTACTKEIQIVDLKAGETTERNARTNAREILADSLPDGRYWLGAYVQVVGAPFVVPAGVADLGVPRGD